MEDVSVANRKEGETLGILRKLVGKEKKKSIEQRQLSGNSMGCVSTIPELRENKEMGVHNEYGSGLGPGQETEVKK